VFGVENDNIKGPGVCHKLGLQFRVQVFEGKAQNLQVYLKLILHFLLIPEPGNLVVAAIAGNDQCHSARRVNRRRGLCCCRGFSSRITTGGGGLRCRWCSTTCY